MCVCAARSGTTDLVGEGKRDVISIGKFYSLRGVFMLIGHTHTNIRSILYTPMQTLMPYWCRDYQTNVLWYTESSLTDNKLKSTHHLLSLVCIC